MNLNRWASEPNYVHDINAEPIRYSVKDASVGFVVCDASVDWVLWCFGVFQWTLWFGMLQWTGVSSDWVV